MRVARRDHELAPVRGGPVRALRRGGGARACATRRGRRGHRGGRGGAFGWPGVAARVEGVDRGARWARRPGWRGREGEVAAGEFDRVVAHWAVPCAWPIALAGEHPRSRSCRTAETSAFSRASPGPRRALRRRRDRDARAARGASCRARAPRVARCAAPTRHGARASSGSRAHRARAQSRSRSRATRRSRRSARSRRAVRGLRGAARAVEARRCRDRVGDGAVRPLVVVGDGPERGSLERGRARAAGARPLRGAPTRTEALAWIASSTGSFSHRARKGCRRW